MKDIVSQYIEKNQFGYFLGMDFHIISPGQVEYSLIIKDNHLATPLNVHGGCISALADACMGVGALTLVAERAQVVTTLEFKVSFLQPVYNGDKLVALSRVKKSGATILFMEAEITNKEGELVAHATGTFKAYDARKAGYLVS